jgi:pSer/pThr/pTyr-binding forkhead associated (FHA) protein
MYVSGVHAQLKYGPATGWCIVDKHSSNGTRLNQRTIQPDVEMSLKAGDIVTIANVNLQVIVN